MGSAETGVAAASDVVAAASCFSGVSNEISGGGEVSHGGAIGAIFGDSGRRTSAGDTSSTASDTSGDEGDLVVALRDSFVEALPAGSAFDFDAARVILSRTVTGVPGPGRGAAAGLEEAFVFSLSLSIALSYAFSTILALEPTVGCVNVVADAVLLSFAAGVAVAVVLDVPLLDDAPADDASFFTRVASSLTSAVCSGIAGVDLLVEITRGRMAFECAAAAALPFSSAPATPFGAGSVASGIRSSRRAPPITRSFFSTGAPSSVPDTFNENTAGRIGPVRVAFVADAPPP